MRGSPRGSRRTGRIEAADRDLLITTFDRLQARLDELAPADRFVVLHGSPHSYNVLLVDDEPGFIDFETACLGPRRMGRSTFGLAGRLILHGFDAGRASLALPGHGQRKDCDTVYGRDRPWRHARARSVSPCKRQGKRREEHSMYDWKQLLARNEQWRRDDADWERRSEPSAPAFAPATQAQIAHEEARLGVRLPPSLRSFYLHSNGYGRVGDFIWAVRPVEHIGWMRDVEPSCTTSSSRTIPRRRAASS